MTTINQDDTIGDVVKYMAPNDYSVEYIRVAAGQNLSIGSVVGLDPASQEVIVLDPNATDSAGFASGIMLENVDTISGNSVGAVMLARHALVVKSKLIFPNTITADQIKIASDQLKSIGIISRTGV